MESFFDIPHKLSNSSVPGGRTWCPIRWFTEGQLEVSNRSSSVEDSPTKIEDTSSDFSNLRITTEVQAHSREARKGEF